MRAVAWRGVLLAWGRATRERTPPRMAATWIKLAVAAFGSPAGTVLRADTTDPRLSQLLNAGLAAVVTDPGGTPPAVPAPNPGGDFTTDAELAAALAGLGGGAGAVTDAVARWTTSADAATRQVAAQPPGTFGAMPGFAWQPVTIDPGVRHQEILGFGAALTDASAYHLAVHLTAAQRSALLRELFDPAQGNLSIVRIPMGASDFSAAPYTYDDRPAGQSDPTLAHFSVAADVQYRIPILREILAINPRVRIIAAPWSPPAWMKADPTVGLLGGAIDPAHFPHLAAYFVLFVQSYAAYGIPIWAVTPQNEPTHNDFGWPTCGWSDAQQITFIGTHLGPAFDAAGLDTRIWTFDDSWNPDHVSGAFADPTAGPYIDGAAWHWYGGSPTTMRALARRFPGKGHIVSEACETAGSPLTIATAHDKLFIGSMRNAARAIVLWNIALDENGQPVNGRGDVLHGLYTIPSDGSGNYTRTVDFWALTQTSRFVRPGAVRIDSTSYAGGVQTVAYLNPDGSVVVVAWNSSNAQITTKVVDARSGRATQLTLPAGEVSTLVWAGVATGTATLPADTIPDPVLPTPPAATDPRGITVPATTARPSLWLRGDRLTGASGSTVTTWPDYSGNHRDAVLVGTAAPTLNVAAVNGQNTVACWEQKLAAPQDVRGADRTILIVFTWPSWNPVELLWAGSTAADTKPTGAPNMYMDGGGAAHLQLLGGSLSISDTPDLVTRAGHPAIYAVSFDSAANGYTATLAVNGTDVVTGTPTGYTPGPVPYLGIGGVGTDYAQGEFAEVIVFESCLSDADRHAWTAYLGQVYGITVGGR